MIARRESKETWSQREEVRCCFFLSDHDMCTVTNRKRSFANLFNIDSAFKCFTCEFHHKSIRGYSCSPWESPTISWSDPLPLCTPANCCRIVTEAICCLLNNCFDTDASHEYTGQVFDHRYHTKNQLFALLSLKQIPKKDGAVVSHRQDRVYTSLLA